MFEVYSNSSLIWKSWRKYLQTYLFTISTPIPIFSRVFARFSSNFLCKSWWWISFSKSVPLHRKWTSNSLSERFLCFFFSKVYLESFEKITAVFSCMAFFPHMFCIVLLQALLAPKRNFNLKSNPRDQSMDMIVITKNIRVHFILKARSTLKKSYDKPLSSFTFFAWFLYGKTALFTFH